MTSQFETPYTFVKKQGWLDIPDFFRFVKGLSKGQQHKYFVYNETLFHKDWCSTIAFNKCRDIQNYIAFARKLNVITSLPVLDKQERKKKFCGTSRHRMVAQGIGDMINNLTGAISEIKTSVSSASGDIREAAKDFTSEAGAFITNANCALNANEERAARLFNASVILSEKVESAVDSSNSLITKFHAITDLLMSKISNFTLMGLVPSIVMLICKFLAMAYLLSQPCNQNVQTVCSILVLIAPLNWGGLYSLGNSLIRAIQGFTQRCFAQDDSCGNVVIGFFELIKSILQSVFTSVNDEGFRKMSLSSNRLRIISDTIKSATTIVDFVGNMVTKLLEVIGDKCLKHFGYLPWFARDRTIEPLIDEYEKIKLEHLEEKCQIQKAAARRILQLHDALVAFETKMHKRFASNAGSNKLAPYVRLMIKNLSDMIARIPDHFRTGKNPRRVKPFWVYIYGDPRIGKSALFQPYIVNALARSLQLIPEYEDYTNYTYFRNCGDEYWEGYYGHDVLWYNDLFQNHADDQAMHKAVMELTNVVDDNLFPLNMAFERKHGVYFDSEVVISNAQSDILHADFIKHKCWSGGAHLFARRNVVLEFTLNPKYAGPGGVGFDQRVVDAEMSKYPDQCFGKVNKLFPKDMYIINVRDPLDGSLQQSNYFGETIDYLQMTASLYKQKQNVFKDKLYDEFREMWSQAGETDEFELDIKYNYIINNLEVPITNAIPTEHYIRNIEKGQKLGRFGRYVIDFTRLPLEMDTFNIASDVGMLISEKCNFDFMKTTSVVSDACVGWIINDDSLDKIEKLEREVRKILPNKFVFRSKNVTNSSAKIKKDPTIQEPYKKFSPKFIDLENLKVAETEEVFFDAKSTDITDAEQYLEPISEEIRKIFPDFIADGWTEEVKCASVETIPVPKVVNGRRVASQAELMRFTKYFTGMNLSLGQKARVILTIEAIGDNVFEKMKPKELKSFCTRAREAAQAFYQHVKNVVLGNRLLQGLFIALSISAAYVSIVSLMYSLMISATKLNFSLYKTPDLEKMKTDIDKIILARSASMTPQTAEGNSQPKVKQVKRILKKGIAQSYDTQNSAVERIISSQICKFGAHVVHSGEIMDRRMYGSGLCVVGDIFIIPDHFAVRWQQMRKLYDGKGDKFVVTLYWNEKQSTDLDWDAISFFKLPYEHTDDLTFMRVKNLIQMRNLTKFFCKVTDSPSLFECYLYGRRAGGFQIGSVGVQRTELASQIYTHPERVDTIYGETLQGREIHIPLCYKYYDTRTINGDCGLLLMNGDSKMNCRKIMGMHTAGELYSAVSSIIYQEDIQEAIKYFEASGDVYQIEDNLLPVDRYESQELEELGLNVIGKLPPINEVGYPVKNNPKICLPRKTKISKSVFHDIMAEDYGPSTVEPAKLRPFTADGERISPLHVGLRKLVKCAPMVEKKYALPIVRHMVQTIKSWPSPYVEAPRLLTDDEIVNGFGNIKPIEMKTSPGYPYVQLDNTNGKIPFFKQEGERWKMGPLVKRKMDEREDDAKRGVVTPTFFIATLKDETRPLEKVAKGKTRIFQISPVDFNMLLRKYFGFFIAHCHATSLIGEMAVGINANSYEWTLLLRRMREVGDLFVNGDGEAFDASTGQPISMYNVEVVNQYYNDGPVHARVRRILYVTFLNARNIIGCLVFIVRQGNMSGIWITTIFNNMTGMFAVRFTYIRLGFDLSTFTKFVRNTHYGDDDLICVNRAVAAFDFFEHARTMQMIGIVYTTALKGAISKNHFQVCEINFLKRAFFLENKLVLPRLPKDVILEIPRWSESDPTKMDDQMNRFNSALLEMSNYEEQDFEKLYSNFEKYIYMAQKIGYSIEPTALFSYGRCWGIKFSNLVGIPIDDSVDLACAKPFVQVLRAVGGSGSDQLGAIDELDCCNLISYETTASMQTQTSEGTTKPPVKQVVRGVKTQGEEIEKDFQCEMYLMEKAKEIGPHVQNIYDYSVRHLDGGVVTRRLRRVCNASHLLFLAYKNFVRLFSDEMETQGEEVGDTKTNERKKSPAEEPGIEQEAAGPFADGDDVVREKSSVFINANVPHQPKFDTRVIRKDWNNIRDVNLPQFYERPYIVKEFDWAASQDLKLLQTISFPSALYTIPALANKLANIKYARPDIEVEVFINATAFHYGMLTMCIVPYPEYTSNAYLQVHSVTTWPQWYSIVAGEDQSIKFTIPYRSLSHTQNAKDGKVVDWAAIKMYVSAPLKSVSTATPTSVGVFVTARLLRPQFSGMLAQGEGVTMGKQGMTTLSAPLGPISSALAGADNVLQAAIPLTHSMGWSVPANATATQPMQVRFPMFCKVDDMPTSQVLGPSQTCQVDKDFSNVNGQLDEMLFDNFINHPALINRHEWTASQPAGTILVNRVVDDGIFVNVQGSSSSIAYFTPLGALVNAHKYWRGTIKIGLRVVASKYHAGRLRVMFCPNDSASPTMKNSVDFKNVTIDVNGTTDTVIEMPFEYIKPWATDGETVYSIKIMVVNALTSGVTTTPQSVYIQMYAWGGEDFQLAYPVKPEWKPDLSYTDAPTMKTQGEEVTACKLTLSSADCAKATKAIWLGDVDRRQKVGNNAQSFVYRSVKQACNMLTPITRYTTKATDNLTNVTVNPIYGVNAIKPTNDIWNCFMIYYRALYYYARGGFRLVCLTSDDLQVLITVTQTDGNSSITNTASTESSPLWEGATTTLADLETLTRPSAFFRNSSLSPPDVIIPYFSSSVCAIPGNGQTKSGTTTTEIPTYSTTTDGANVMFTSCKVCVSNQKTAKNFILFVAGADDFMLGCRRGIPQMRKTDSTARTLRSLPIEAAVTYTPKVERVARQLFPDLTESDDSDEAAIGLE